MNFQQSLFNILSDPSFEPPECLLDLNLKGVLEDLLESCSKEDCVRFAINEAKLVIPFFEAVYPDDDRPRKVSIIIEEWLENPKTNVGAASIVANAAYLDAAFFGATVAVAFAAFAAIDVADAVAFAAFAATIHATTTYAATIHAATADAVAAVRRANPSISLEDQLRRLFKIMEVK